MVSGAIADAQRSLLEQEEFLRMEQQNKELLKIVVSEKQKNTELFQNIQQQEEVQKILVKEKKSAEYTLDALEYRKVATEFVDDLTGKCLDRLMNRAMLKDDKFKKDVAADTRQLEQTNKKMKIIIDEVEREFFPYVYQKAERVFVHSLADSFLKDGKRFFYNIP
jgi:CRISPR/Cas system CSM-associated protein Csm3 (group 7 of RAMP superfamily)